MKKSSPGITQGAYVLDLCEGNGVRRDRQGRSLSKIPIQGAQLIRQEDVNYCDVAFQELQFLDVIQSLN